ncbi:MAG: hypothetical protein LC808_19960 [Actinobacteria bacterium]|nr:hypothetical protein [Actinomycetota bacterium]
MTIPGILPRFIRLRDAPAYLGMDRHRFNFEVRPHLVEIPIGDQGISFDRVDLDAWADEYKARNGRRAKGELACRPSKKERPASSRGAGYGTLTSRSEASEFARALEQATSLKR